MKTILFLMSLFSSISLMAQQNTILILKDHSGSIQCSEKQLELEEQLLKKVLLTNIKSVGDKAIISYLYRNTASLSNEREMSLEIPEKFSDQKSRLQLFKLSFISQVIKELETNQPLSDRTHILEAIPRMLKWTQNNKLRVVILSDMLEYSPRRKLSRLTSREDAINKAKSDVQFLIENYGITPSNAEIRIDCHLPVSMMENKAHYQYLSFYWNTVFTAFFPNTTLNFQTL